MAAGQHQGRIDDFGESLLSRPPGRFIFTPEPVPERGVDASVERQGRWRCARAAGETISGRPAALRPGGEQVPVAQRVRTCQLCRAEVPGG